MVVSDRGDDRDGSSSMIPVVSCMESSKGWARDVISGLGLGKEDEGEV
jgi:hypothetical protein